MNMKNRIRAKEYQGYLDAAEDYMHYFDDLIKEKGLKIRGG